jgi:branched-chain amino acid aminotransferase
MGAPEALMLTEEGLVAECTGDNIFIVKDGEIWTPPIHLGILDGVTRSSVIEIAQKAGYTVREKSFTLYNVYSADECFLTGTAAEIIAVTDIDGRIIGDGTAGAITKNLLDEFQDYVKGKGEKI